MSTLRNVLLLTVALATNTDSRTSLPWGTDGHRIIAEIALGRLSPSVANETRRLLGGQNITDVASWADNIRSANPNTGPWHYVDIQITDTSYVPERDCAAGCVVGAVEAQIAILSNRSNPDTARATALKFVVHFIGDLHQPLHAGENHDKGGNSVQVNFMERGTNLHSLWDSGLLLSYGQGDADIVKEINDELSRRRDITTIASGDVVTWVMQSHDLSRDIAYGKLGRATVITTEYAEAAKPVIHEQLLRGGVRLAAVLERALGSQ